MGAEHQRVQDQAALWNGHAGEVWVEAQALVDRLFRPIEDFLAESYVEQGGGRALDIGCGTGSIARAVTRRSGAQGSCTGIDISGPMIAAARLRAAREGLATSFIQADAQTHGFEPGSFDIILSRFGVMFFDDPVQAFANLRRASSDGALLHMVVWRSAAENPFMTTAERAAAPFMPDMPQRVPHAPGQFAFADPDYVRLILEKSGWTDIDIAPADFGCTMSETDLIPYFTRFGFLGLLLGQADDDLRARIVENVRPAFDPFVHGDEVRFTAACWVVSARPAAA